MKNFKKITASIAAAALCAVSAMSTAINANAATPDASYKYTYRAILLKTECDKTIQIDWGYSHMKSSNVWSNMPKVGSYSGSIKGGGSAGDTYENCGGTFTPYYPITGTGKIFTITTFAKPSSSNPKKPATFTEGTMYATAYKRYAGKIVKIDNNAGLKFEKAFLVGDVNRDGKIDDGDKSFYQTALNNSYDANGKRYADGVYNRSFCDTIYINGKAYPAYIFDIDNNNYIDHRDKEMLDSHIQNSQLVTRFES